MTVSFPSSPCSQFSMPAPPVMVSSPSPPKKLMSRTGGTTDASTEIVSFMSARPIENLVTLGAGHRASVAAMNMHGANTSAIANPPPASVKTYCAPCFEMTIRFTSPLSAV